MPTVFYDEKQNRYFFFSNEGTEPPHIHVEHAGLEAKFWLGPPLKLEYNSGFNGKQLKFIESEIEKRRNEIEQAWNEHFGQ